MNEHDGHIQSTDPTVYALALRSIGRSGADIERLIREARQMARRETRSLTYNDVVAKLSQGKPERSYASKWRRAVHEAGHALARHILAMGTVDLVTINGSDGTSFVLGTIDTDTFDTENLLMDCIVTLLAGRASEELVLGQPGLGSGGGKASDLAKATEIALALETEFGTSAKNPLLHIPTLSSNGHAVGHELTSAVNDRLVHGYEKAMAILMPFQDSLMRFASELTMKETLVGESLQHLLQSITSAEQT